MEWGGADSSPFSQIFIHQMPKVLSPSAGGDQGLGKAASVLSTHQLPPLRGLFTLQRWVFYLSTELHSRSRSANIYEPPYVRTCVGLGG